MTIQIHDVIQGEERWHFVKAGVPSASHFQEILSPKAGKEGVGRMKYLRRLAAERITGKSQESGFKSADMDRGNEQEPHLRKLYAFNENVEPQIVGFITNKGIGCSPDSLIGNDGALEIKSARPDILIEFWEKGEFPSVHVAQTQGVLLVTEREWIDIFIGWHDPDAKGNIAPFIKRAYRNTSYLLTLRSALNQFEEELQAQVERSKRYGLP